MMNADQPPLEFETVAKLDAHLRENRPLTACVFQGLDLRLHTAALTAGRLTGSAFLGCQLEPGAVAHALSDKALVVPKPEGIPFDPFRGSLYSVEQDLYAGYVTGQPGGYAATRDARIYAHFCATGRSNPPNILESLYRRLHDHGMSDALEETLSGHRVVAIMGGHGLARDAEEYRAVALLGRALARANFVVVTGGGPGAMEAAHLGAWHAGRRDEDLDTAIAILGHAPLYTPDRALARHGARGPAPLRRRPPGDEHRHPDVALRARAVERVPDRHRQVLRQQRARGRPADDRHPRRRVRAGQRRHDPGSVPGRGAEPLPHHAASPAR